MRLIAFGCENTIGKGLPDVYPNNDPSQYAWPSVLSKKLNIECLNLAKSGNSNINILRQILNFKFEKDDIVAILWTYFDREDIYEADDRVIHVRNHKSKYINWLNLYNPYSLNLKRWLHVHHTDLYLKSKSVIVFHQMFDNTVPQLSEVEIENCVVEPIEYLDYTIDDEHPGVKSQELLAEKYYKRIMNVLR